MNNELSLKESKQIIKTSEKSFETKKTILNLFIQYIMAYDEQFPQR